MKDAQYWRQNLFEYELVTGEAGNFLFNKAICFAKGFFVLALGLLQSAIKFIMVIIVVMNAIPVVITGKYLLKL